MHLVQRRRDSPDLYRRGRRRRTRVAFKVAPNPDGTWTQSVLYRITGGRGRGNPEAGLSSMRRGNLDGTTTKGVSTTCPSESCGVVFKLKPNPDDHSKRTGCSPTGTVRLTIVVGGSPWISRYCV